MKGFSLIELLVVITIGGILLTIAWVRMSTLVPIYRLGGRAGPRGGVAEGARACDRGKQMFHGELRYVGEDIVQSGPRLPNLWND